MNNGPMNPYLAGFLLGLVLLATIFVTGRGLGASGASKNVVVAAVGAVAPDHAAANPFYAKVLGPGHESPLKGWLVFEIAGVLLGAFVSGLASDRLKLVTERGPRVAVWSRLTFALLGGSLFGVGAQLARGCTSGAALSGMAVLSVAGFLTMFAIFGTGFAFSWATRGLWLQRNGSGDAMGPLVPDLISDELNLVVALVLGFLFGWVLEQAGFSSSRRLVGVFYGYDLTVLRVFFTAAVTAALGVLLLASAGLLDLRAVFVNPTWFWPAIAGGVLMGFGFLLGGYCPGTSFCGAAIGKIDAMVFSAGGLLGIFAYAELFPRLQAFADSTALGPLQVPEWLGISPGLFVLLLAAAAVLIFAVGGRIERRIAPSTAPSIAFPARRHAVAAASLLTIALFAALLPGRTARLEAKVKNEGYVPRHAVRSMTPDELAFRLVDRDPRTRVFDLRDEAARAAHPMPGATPVPAAAILEKQWQAEFGSRHVRKILIAATEDEARFSAYLLGEAGYENLAILAGGYESFERTILANTAGAADEGRYAPDVARFRRQAQATLLERIRLEREAPSAPRAAPKTVKGGC